MHSVRKIALGDYPPVPSQGKILKVLKGDRIALPTGSHITPPMGDCS
ncbi:hypothetical protein [Cylindrospermopsis raciborskii]|nr:hypothetical protein [Cylindrospermopsis raciborskii]